MAPSALEAQPEPKVPPPELGPTEEPSPPPRKPEEEQVKGLLFGSADTLLSLEYHGFLNVESYYFQDQAEHPGPSFDLHNFYVATKTRIGSKVTVFAEVEHEHGASIKVDRAFIEWAPDARLNVRVGRFYVPFSYERAHYWAPARPMASRPLLVDIPFHEWSDTGIEVLGRYAWLGYDVAVVNGPQGLTESGITIVDVRDNNRNKAFVGRVNVFPWPNVEAGMAYAQGTFDHEDALRFRMIEANLQVTVGPVTLWSEYDERFGDDEPCEAATDPSCDPLFVADPGHKRGYYVLASVFAMRDSKYVHYLKPIVRFDSIEVVGTETGARRVTLGLNWSPMAHLLIRGEYQVIREFGGPQRADNGAMLSAIADF